jgi:hypothetical protein
MESDLRLNDNSAGGFRQGSDSCQSIDWYHEGSARTVRIGDVEVTIRYVGRKGRRGRIAITAPNGASFR